ETTPRAPLGSCLPNSGDLFIEQLVYRIGGTNCEFAECRRLWRISRCVATAPVLDARTAGLESRRLCGLGGWEVLPPRIPLFCFVAGCACQNAIGHVIAAAECRRNQVINMSFLEFLIDSAIAVGAARFEILPDERLLPLVR